MKEECYMVYTLCKYADDTLVTFSDIRKKENGDEYIRVSFERPKEYGFDTVVFEQYGYKVYFWSNENNEPIHVHISKGKPQGNSTKGWRYT